MKRWVILAVTALVLAGSQAYAAIPPGSKPESTAPAKNSNLIGNAVDHVYPLYIDGSQAPVDVIAIKGASYLPVKAAEDLFGYAVTFSNNTVMLDKTPVATYGITTVDNKTPINQNDAKADTGTAMQFNYMTVLTNPIVSLLIGVLLAIIISWCCYRRSSRNLEKQIEDLEKQVTLLGIFIEDVQNKNGVRSANHRGANELEA